MKYGLIILGIIAALALFVATLYNRLIRLRNNVKNAFSKIDVQLKKRYDLIPNLVETVKKYMEHEKDLLTDITRLRSNAIETPSTEEEFKLNSELSQKLAQLNVQIENYPDLKANENVLHLQQNLKEVEEDISMSRNFYNNAVTEYNTQIQVFPNVLLAGMMGFKPEFLFEIPEFERDNVDVGSIFNS